MSVLAAAGLGICLGFALAGCATPAGPARSTELVDAAWHHRTDLIFGLGLPGGGQVTESQWQSFVEQILVPAFPDGFTVTQGSGVYRPRAGGPAIREPVRIVTLYHHGSAKEEGRIETVIAAYCRRFRQESVLRHDAAGTASLRRPPIRANRP